MGSRRNDWLSLLAGCACCLAALALAEWGLRRSDPEYLGRLRDNSLDRLNEYSEIYGWAPRPGARALERGLLTVLNAQGYRGAQVPRAHGGRPRVVLVGDSTAFGYAVADALTYARRLESSGFEVVNLGVLGYGPDQALLKLEREGLSYSPDVVLLSLCVDNDFADARSPVYLYDGRHPKPYFTLEAGGLRPHDEHLALSGRERLGVWLMARSQLYARLSGLLARGGPGETWRARRQRLIADEPAAVELVRALVGRMRADAAARGARFLLLSHPSKDSYKRGSSLWDALRERLAGDGVETLDLAAEYHARGLRFADLVLDPTGHLSPAGHAAAAEALLARLRPP